jgi:hypothetical protein
MNLFDLMNQVNLIESTFLIYNKKTQPEKNFKLLIFQVDTPNWI